MVERGVVEAIGEMNPARTGRGQAHSDLAGRLGMPTGYEGRGLLMVNKDEFHPASVAAQSFHNAVDAVAGHTEDRLDPPVGDSRDQQFGCNGNHDSTSLGVVGGIGRHLVPGNRYARTDVNSFGTLALMSSHSPSVTWCLRLCRTVWMSRSVPPLTS